MKLRATTSLKYILILALLFIALFGLRWAWSGLFHTADPPRPISGGFLDMRGIDLNRSPAFFLNGEWEFYPGQLMTREDLAGGEHPSQMIQVPGDWGDDLNSDAGTSYGVGTYRLRIQVDPLERPIALWLKNVQASSMEVLHAPFDSDPQERLIR